MKHLPLYLSLLLAPSLSVAEPHWGYSGHAGPEQWGSIHHEYATCAKGKEQSPINIQAHTDAPLAALELSYQTLGETVRHNGHSLQVDFPKGSQLKLAGQSYQLKQFHAHTPSEHSVNGQSFPAELHLVHANAQGELAVVAVNLAQGQAHPAWDALLSAAPAALHSHKLSQSVNAQAFLPKTLEYYFYQGSLTTPPCSEQVQWLVLKEPVELSAVQLAQLQKIIGFANNRPLQPLNQRVVME